MVIQAEKLFHSFDGGRTAVLRDLSLSVSPGEFVAVIGLSGAGKSTLLRALNGSVVPTGGTLRVLEVDVRDASGERLRQLRRQVGFIFQQFHLLKNLTALRNVLAGRLAYVPLWRALTGLFPSDETNRARAALDAVGLSGRYNAKVRELSGGQQQRVAIARALVQEPKLILADEPMASLDPRLGEMVLKILRRFNRERGLTVLVNIHSPPLARAYADRILALREGQVVFDGPPAALTPEIEREVYRVEGDEP